jgi:hypothetical protein
MCIRGLADSAPRIHIKAFQCLKKNDVNQIITGVGVIPMELYA